MLAHSTSKLAQRTEIKFQKNCLNLFKIHTNETSENIQETLKFTEKHYYHNQSKKKK